MIIRLLALLALLLVGVTSASAQGNCPRLQAVKGVQQTAMASGATIEPVHQKNGVAILVKARGPLSALALHRAADQYAATRAASSANKSARDCETIWRELARGSLSESIEKTPTGFVVTYATRNPRLVHMLHKDTCCQWCVCPAGSVTSCARCC